MGNVRDRIRQQIREQICTICREGHSGGGCGHSADDPCVLIVSVDEIMEVISGISDYSLEPYHDRIREVVCSTCKQDETGHCATRDEGRCALDNHFPKVVAIIEKELAADPGLA